MDILLQWLGFILLTAPFVLPGYIPFDDSAFRFDKTNTCISTALLLAFLATGFALLHIMVPDGCNIQLFGTIYIAVSVMLLFAVYWAVLRDVTAKKVIASGICIVSGVTDYVLSTLVLYHILPFYAEHATESYMFTLPGVVCYFIMAMFMILLQGTFFSKVMLVYFRETVRDEIKRQMFFFVSATFLYLAVMMSIGAIDRYENASELLPIRLAVVIFALFCVSESYFFLFWEVRQVKERDEVKYLLDIQRLQFEKLSSDMENVKYVRHDIKYLFRSLGTLITSGQVGEALDLIGQEAGRIENVERYDYCKEPSLNSLIQYYAEKMRSAGIEFQTNILLNTPPIPISELLILAGNLLENALESCSACDCPSVKLNAAVVNSMLVFYMENTCDGICYADHPRTEHGQWLHARDLLTRKNGGGTGLKSIEQIAKSHYGTAEYRLEQGIFVSRVILEIA